MRNEEPLPLWDRIFLGWAALCLAVGIFLLAACEPLKNDEPAPQDKHSVPIEYGTPK